MDRRRKLLVLFLIVLVIAALDIQANGIDIVDQWGSLFEMRTDGVRPGDPSAFAQGNATHSATHSAQGINTFVLYEGNGRISVQGADTDVVTIEVNVHTLTRIRNMAQVYADQFRVFLEQVDDELHATWHAPERTDNIRLAQMTWNITVPHEMALRIQSGPGFVSIRDTTGPVQVHGAGTYVDLMPAQAAPIDMIISSGEARVLLPPHAVNHNVHAVVQFGSITHPLRFNQSPEEGLQRAREGSRTIVSGTLGDGEYPLVLHVTGGRAELHISP